MDGLAASHMGRPVDFVRSKKLNAPDAFQPHSSFVSPKRNVPAVTHFGVDDLYNFPCDRDANQTNAAGTRITGSTPVSKTGRSFEASVSPLSLGGP